MPIRIALGAAYTTPGFSAQPNVNAGVEIGLTERVVLDLGAFTDLSAVPQSQHEKYGIDRIHLFGGSAALGILGRRSRAWFGTSFEIGAGESLVPTSRLTLEDALQDGLVADEKSTATRWTLAGILGSNYTFAEGD